MPTLQADEKRGKFRISICLNPRDGGRRQNGAVLDSPRRQYDVQLEPLRKYARRKEIPEEVVVGIFETERLRLTERAKVKRFIDVLAEKRAKRTLEQRFIFARQSHRRNIALL